MVTGIYVLNNFEATIINLIIFTTIGLIVRYTMQFLIQLIQYVSV
jgi:hypothetical protein